MSEDVRDLLDEFKALEKDRVNWEITWDEIFENICPYRSGFERDTEKGVRHDSLVYDGTPQSAVNMYAAGSQGYLLSSSYKWFGLRVPQESLMDVRNVRMWLSIVEQVLYGLIQRSNFYKHMVELFRDGGSIGTATIYSYFDPGTRRVWYQTRHPKEIYIAEDANEEVDTVMRYFEMTPKTIMESFRDDEIDDEIEKMFDRPEEKYKKLPILHIVKPRPDWDPERKDSKVKRWASYYIDVEHEVIMRESGYDVFPYGVWRVEKNTDETYGRGPGWTALADIKGLYAYTKSDIHAAQLMISPPLDIPKERKGLVDYVPGGRNYYEDANRKITPLQTNVNLRAGLDREERKQRIIEKHFLVDFFMMMAQAEKEMTATEIRRRQEEKAVLLGPHITGLNQDVLDKLIDRLFQDAWDNGLLPPPPVELIRAGGHIEVDYMGPLAQAQRSFFKTEPYRQSLGDLVGVAQLRPEILDNYNWDYISRQMSLGNGLPEQAFLDEKMVAQVRQIRQQQQQAMMAAQQAKTVGQGVSGLNEPVQKGSLLDAMGQAAAQSGP